MLHTLDAETSIRNDVGAIIVDSESVIDVKIVALHELSDPVFRACLALADKTQNQRSHPLPLEHSLVSAIVRTRVQVVERRGMSR